MLCMAKTLKLTQLKIKEITKFIKATAIENEKSKWMVITNIPLEKMIGYVAFFIFSLRK